ncbi:MAG TPA: alpha/beta hydrolase [Rhizomicrobium sp.]|nr:alpha/beta hydrolase [Rhizomicrobium sp.]
MRIALFLALLLAAPPVLAQSAGWQPATSAKPAVPGDAPPLRIAPPGEAPALPQLRTASPVAEQPAPASFMEAPVARATRFPGGVSAQFDIAWRAPLTLDLYRPAASRPLPLLVFLHGRAWNGGDARQSASMADLPRELAALAARGYVVAGVTVRPASEARFPAPVQDVKAAIRWLRRQASSYNIDPTRVALWGEGTGGHLAALTGASCGVPLFDSPGMGEGSDCVQAVIDWSGPVELGPDSDGRPAGPVSMPTTPEGVFLGCEPRACAPGLVQQASPLTYLSEVTPPFLIQQGAADPVLPQSQALAAALKARGVPVELVTYPETGQDFRRDGVPDPATLRAALDKVAVFLGQIFPAPARNARLRARGPVY